MKAAVDLHIHSCLSPCADDDMTPNNIVNMALLKKLDIISVTDHNSAGNVAAVMEVAKDKDILILPGMEVNSREEVHLLCYFASLDSITAFDRFLYPYIPEVPNHKNIFGSQLLCNEQDKVIGEEKNY
ncbi:MAG: PHP domain-containing protein [Clostridia bacterium]|jgi:predicted metal-dependent phosphoesterase TrpH